MCSRFIADLHIHSHYSRATSKEMYLENISYWAKLKGIRVVGTGDFTHPAWFEELKEKLVPTDENGLYKLAKDTHQLPQCLQTDVYFIPSAEVSCIYSKGGKVRKIHLVVIFEKLEEVALFNTRLSNIGNLTADGRPIVGIDAKLLLQMVLDVSEKGIVIPAHVWTPHFSLFGAFSGFDSLKECFEDLSDNIYAIETGLSSDPPMNWCLSELDNVRLISNSDAHSPMKLGREANIFDTCITYDSIFNAIKTGNGLVGTIEFFPEEGKYHFDGHRNCKVWMSPEETIKHGYKCPVCGNKLTVGVMHRVVLLADREKGFTPPQAKPFYSIIPLQEILSEALKTGVNTKKVKYVYMKILSEIGPELYVLMDAPIEDIKKVAGEVIAEGIKKMREGKVSIRPGYDGEYGSISIFVPQEVSKLKGQDLLF